MSPLDGIAVAQSPGWSGWWIVAGITGVIVLVIVLVIAQFFRLWLQAYMGNAGVNPKVIDVPAPGWARQSIDVVAMDA